MPDSRPEDVTLTDSSTVPDAESTPSSPAAAVPAVEDEVMIGDRPLKNIIAEIDRKNEARITALKGEMLAAFREVRTPPPATAQREYTDEELAQLAAAGDARSLDLLTDRKSARHAAQQAASQQQFQTQVQTLQSLLSRYPVLRDDAHPLTAYASQVKLSLMQRGAADDILTIIDSIKTAIADNPALAAQSAVQPPAPSVTVPVATRPAIPTAHAATPTPRRSAPTPRVGAITDAQWELAKRYGFKTREDAAKAIANFEKRQDSGMSRLGGVAAFVREDA